MSHLFKTEGLTLFVSPFSEYDKIVSLFTPDRGFIKLFCKGSRKKQYPFLSPLMTVDVVYIEGKSNLFQCREITPLYTFPLLRSSLSLLKTACALTQLITDTHPFEKAAPDLYKLLQIYLRKLHEAKNPEAILASFRLKLLKYEGVLPPLDRCSTCEKLLEEMWVVGDELFCSEHANGKGNYYSAEERKLIDLLTSCRDFGVLAALDHEICLDRLVLFTDRQHQ